jgi:hypothetical protein
MLYDFLKTGSTVRYIAAQRYVDILIRKGGIKKTESHQLIQGTTIAD